MTFLTSEELKNIITDPVEIVRQLDKYIIGQDHAKKSLALMMLRRGLVGLQMAGHIPSEPVFDKSNVMLIGDTGTGKTSLMRALAEVNGSPIGIDDITEVTAAGYVGGKVEEIIERYVLLCEEWVQDNHAKFVEMYSEDVDGKGVYIGPSFESLVRQEVENGIIYIDEIDKIKKRDKQGVDINGDMLQNELLKFLENGRVNLWQNTKRSESRSKAGINHVDTSNLVFVCGGAFQGLDEIIKRRRKKDTGIGFTSEIIVTDRDEIISSVTTEDLIAYGFKPEFLGRIPLRTSLNKLTVEDMKLIITMPKNNLYDQYRLAFNMFNISLSIDEKALEHIAKKSLELNIGARSLKQTFTTLLSDILFNIYSFPDKELKIGLEYVKDKL